MDAALQRWGTDSVAALRMVQNEQLDDLWRRVFAAIVSGDLSHIDRAIRILKRRSELWGMDAPRQHEISGPGGSAVRTDVGDMLIARLEELRERQGPLVDDLDEEPLAMLPSSSAGDIGDEPGLPTSIVDVFPLDETPVEPIYGDDGSNGDGYTGSGLDGP